MENVNLQIKLDHTVARLVIQAYRAGRDPRRAWDMLIKRTGSPTAVRDYVRSEAPDETVFRAVMDALGIPSDADLCCASCGVVLEDPRHYSEPHGKPDKTRCRYVRVHDIRFLEEDVVDGDIPRDDVREDVIACDDDEFDSAVGIAARTIRDLGLTETDSAPTFYDPNGSQIEDYRTGERSEKSAHLYGFTGQEERQIRRMVDGDPIVPDDDGPDGLNAVMEFDHVIRVHEDGSISEPRNIYAPSSMIEPSDDPDATLRAQLTREGGWSLLDGYSGQQSYAGPVMHPSEFIGGGIAKDILSTPGLYVALVVETMPEDDNAESEADGWVVAHIPA